MPSYLIKTLIIPIFYCSIISCLLERSRSAHAVRCTVKIIIEILETSSRVHTTKHIYSPTQTTYGTHTHDAVSQLVPCSLSRHSIDSWPCILRQTERSKLKHWELEVGGGGSQSDKSPARPPSILKVRMSSRVVLGSNPLQSPDVQSVICFTCFFCSNWQ